MTIPNIRSLDPGAHDASSLGSRTLVMPSDGSIFLLARLYAISAPLRMQHVEVFFTCFFLGNEKVLDKQYLSLVKVALTFEIKTWNLIDYCGFWIACLMRDMQLTYGDVMWITVWEVLVVSYCKMIINDSTLYWWCLSYLFPKSCILLECVDSVNSK